jgi:hypothetical protein
MLTGGIHGNIRVRLNMNIPDGAPPEVQRIIKDFWDRYAVPIAEFEILSIEYENISPASVALRRGSAKAWSEPPLYPTAASWDAAAAKYGEMADDLLTRLEKKHAEILIAIEEARLALRPYGYTVGESKDSDEWPEFLADISEEPDES